MEQNRSALEEQQKPPVDGPGRARRLSELEVRDILLDKRVMREIASEYGISRGFVAKIKNRTASYFQDRGSFRGTWEPNAALATLPVVVAPVGPPTKLDEGDVEKILGDHRTLKKIAKEMGISISTVWRVKNRAYQGRSKDFRRPPTFLARIGNKLIMKENA